MLGIIGALDIEVEILKKSLEAPQRAVVSGIEFVSGKLWGVSAVVAKSGVGKVNSAACAEAMILKYSPSVIINTGVGGALTPELSVMDAVVASDVVQHDFDTTACGDPHGFIPEINGVKLAADMAVSDAISAAVKELGIKCVTGTVATGDKFVSSERDKEFLRNTFGAVCCEMEGAAIGQVCFINGVRFAVLRSVSDNADGSSPMDFPTFAPKAAENAVRIIERMIKSVGKTV